MYWSKSVGAKDSGFQDISVVVMLVFFFPAWLCVLRDIKSPQNSERNDRGPQEYVEKNPNPNLHCKLTLCKSFIVPVYVEKVHAVCFF